MAGFDPSTRGRFEVSIEADTINALDECAAKTGWWPERLASRGTFGAAARMAARFACRATCHPDAVDRNDNRAS
jgi:hypothetical protein